MIKVCYPFVGDSLGGSHISTLTLVDFIKKEKPGINANVLVFSANSAFLEYLSNNDISYKDFGLKLRNYSKLTIVLDIFKSIYYVVKYLKKEKIDIVHTNDLRMNLIFLVASKFVATKHIWHQRTSMPQSVLGQKIFLLSDKFLTISRFIFNQIIVPISFDKAIIVFNPVESFLASSEDLKNRENMFYKKKPTLLYLSNMTKQKNPDFFLRIARNLSINFPASFKFLMVGRIDDDIQQTIDYDKQSGNLDTSFEIIGYQENIKDLLLRSDYLIAPAKNDGFGRIIVEAMRAGVIVIAYSSGGYVEIIKNNQNGILVKDLDEELFISKILKVQNNFNLYSYMLHNAHQDASKKYSVEKHAKLIDSIYQSMLKV